ncbi:MAG TPA: hypothetical protein VHD61_15805 [Lacunisphaera sp.]|nr:hypothetical protein [Lacunisphaera sp.]
MDATTTIAKPPAPAKAAEFITCGDPSHIVSRSRDYWAVNLYTHGGNCHLAEVTGFTCAEAINNAKRLATCWNSHDFLSRLADLVSGLNPDCLELGAGMMAQLQQLAQDGRRLARIPSP